MYTFGMVPDENSGTLKVSVLAPYQLYLIPETLVPCSGNINTTLRKKPYIPVVLNMWLAIVFCVAGIHFCNVTLTYVAKT
jgi:hypothetical protein